MNELMREMGNAARGTVTLGGRAFPVTELNWNDYCAVEDEFGKDPREWRGVKAARFILWLGLRKHEPSLTLEEVGELVGSGEFEAAAGAVRRMLGTPKNG